MDKVILSQRYLEEAINQLRQRFQLVIAMDEGRPLAKVLAENPDCRGLITFLSDRIDAALIAAGPNLRIIANYAAGTNNIDIPAARERGIFVTHTPDILTDATADLTMALILAVARRLVPADRFTRQGRFAGWGAMLFLGRELKNARLGIIGLGRIGQAVARRALGFGLRVSYYSHTRKPVLEKELGLDYAPFLELVGSSDIVSLHLPYSPGVHHLFNRDAFTLMKKEAIFINVARGPLMDENALAEKLEQGELFGAGLDVYEFEPTVNEKLKNLDNVVLAPHIGSATRQTRLGMANMTVTSVSEALAGREPPHLVPEWHQRCAPIRPAPG